MSDTLNAFVWPGAALAVTFMLCLTALKAWRGWLELRREELHASRAEEERAKPEMGARIEMADVRERLRKLEAIAKGVDL
jgi:hypothetical protein